MKPKSTGLKHMASGGGPGKSKGRWRSATRKYPYLAICIHNEGNEASLERGKAYRVIKPLPNDPPARIRVIDNEDEDYLYRADEFIPLEISDAEKKSVMNAIVVP